MLTMTGPQFLLFYATFAFIVYMAVRGAIAKAESSMPSNGRVRDPYEIAFLRGGLNELVRVVALALNLRGLLQVAGHQLRPAEGAESRQLEPIEREVLRQSRGVAKPSQIADGPGVQAAADRYRAKLTEQGLLADGQIRRLRGGPALVGIVVLLCLSGAKIHVATSTGHRNVGFLVILTALAVLLLATRVTRRRTGAGDLALANLSNLFRGLKQRRRSLAVGAESDATLLAAVYGGVAGSGVDASTWRRMFTRQDGSSSSSCSSSCGGGGGCGGGGCGGCGS